MRRKLQSQRLGETQQPGLRSAVGGTAKVPHVREDRSDIHDPAELLRNHPWSERPCAQKRSGEICFDQSVPLFAREFEHGLAEDNSSVVDENVRRTEALVYLIPEPRHYGLLR